MILNGRRLEFTENVSVVYYINSLLSRPHAHTKIPYGVPLYIHINSLDVNAVSVPPDPTLPSDLPLLGEISQYKFCFVFLFVWWKKKMWFGAEKSWKKTLWTDLYKANLPKPLSQSTRQLPRSPSNYSRSRMDGGAKTFWSSNGNTVLWKLMVALAVTIFWKGIGFGLSCMVGSARV